jgi:hypothetical protein
MAERSNLWTVRRAVAACASLGAAAIFHLFDDHVPWALWLPTGLLIASAALVWHGRLTSQLLARAVWWSNLLLGALLAVSGASSERALGGWLAISTGAALLAAARRGLDTESAFSPVAYRTSLMGILVMALADAQSLLLFGTLQLTEKRSWHEGVATLALWLAGAALVAIVGLYRLKLWGLVLNLIVNVAIVGVALGGLLDLPTPLLWAYVATSTLQLVLATPLVIALVRRVKPQARAPKLSRFGFAPQAIAIAGLMAISAACAFVLRSAIWHI